MSSDRRLSFVQRQLRSEVRRFVTSARGLIIKTVVLTVVVCAVPLALHSPGYVAGLTQGVMVVAVPAMVVFGFLLSGDGALLLAGAYGESFTREELATAVTRGFVWSAVHNIEVNRSDIDHLLFTPAGVLVIESKWRFRGADAAWLMSAAGQAQAAARKGKLILYSKHVGYRTPVRPVLVVWGGARRELAPVSIIDGVPVVCGQALLGWLERCSHGEFSEQTATELHCRLALFAGSRLPAG